MKRVLSIVKPIIIICVIIISIFFIKDKIFINATNSVNSDELINITAKYYQTKERNYEKGHASYLTMQQNDLFNFADLIFEGTFKYSENYTYIYYEDSDEYQEYFTFYYFVVNNVYYGDETLSNKIIKLGIRNIGKDNDLAEIILKENSNYVLFTEKYDNPDFKYLISLYQYTFEIYDSNIYISHELFGQNTKEEKIEQEVSDFMDFWLKKQSDEDKIILDGLLNEKIFTYSNIETIKSILNINEINIDTNIGEKTRLSLKKSVFNDFITDAIDYYKGNK